MNKNKIFKYFLNKKMINNIRKIIFYKNKSNNYKVMSIIWNKFWDLIKTQES